MKPIAVSCLLLAFALGGRGVAEEKAAEEKAARPDKTPEYRLAVQKAISAFTAHDFSTTLQQCEVLDGLTPNSPVVLNMRAAVAVEEHRFEEGAEYCRRALEIDPRLFTARFNLAEIPFLQKHYAEARDLYEELRAERPTEELLEYRIYLTWLLEGNEGAAQDALKRMKYPGESGAYYYAQAAWSFAHKQTTEAMGWIQSGDWVFSRDKNFNYADVLYDLGWLKRPEVPAGSTSELVAK